MTATVLLTGCGGQLGFELRRTLAPLGRVVAVDVCDVNFCDLDALRKLVNETNPHVIVNAAAYTAVDRAESEREVAFNINGYAPGVLAEELARAGGKVIIHYSTDYVFNGAATQPYTEECSPAPVNVYGDSKLAGERAVSHAGVPHTIFRTEWLYATRGSNFLLTILRLARDGKALRIVADQVGAPTWARMVAEASAQVVARFLKGSAADRDAWSGLYHLTAAGQTTWHGFTEAILRESLRQSQLLKQPIAWCERALASLTPIPASEYPTVAARPAYSLLSNEKIGRVFGIHLPDWHDQLRLALEEFDFNR